jgi:hypothetical protein
MAKPLPLEDPARMETPCRFASAWPVKNTEGGIFHSERFKGEELPQRSMSGRPVYVQVATNPASVS